MIFVAGALVAIGVRAQAASLTFAWTAPVTNADGTPLTDLSSYRVYVATSAQGCPGSSYVAIATPTPAPHSGDAVSVRLASLTAGVTYFGAVTAVDAAGLESDCTLPVSAIPQPDFTVSPTTAIDFGTTPVGTAVDSSFIVRNVTTSDLMGSASVGAPFSIVSGGSFSLAPGASQTVIVRLLSAIAGSFASNVSFTAEGDTTSRAVTGSATTAATTATLTVTRSGSGTVSSSPTGISCGSTCTKTMTTGTTLALAAVPATGSTFAGWSGGGCSGTATCSVTLTTNTTVNATFTASPPPPPAGEILLDNAAAGVQDPAGGRTFTGAWCLSGATNQYGANSLRSCGKRGDTYRWTPTIQVSGTYDVYIWVPKWGKGSSSVPVTVTYAGGSTLRTLNERRATGGWVLHGRYPFNAGTAGYVQTDDSAGMAMADAVRLVPVP